MYVESKEYVHQMRRPNMGYACRINETPEMIVIT